MKTRFKFTDAKLKALPTTKTRVTYYDTDFKALSLRVSPTGTKSFCVFRRIHGNPERITLGQFPGLKTGEARQQAARVLASIQVGDNPAAVRRANREELTLDTLFDEYCAAMQGTKRSLNTDVTRYRVWIKPICGGLKLSRIGPDHAKKIIARGGVEQSGTTSNRALALLQSLFGWGVRQGYCVANPVKGVQRHREVSRERFLMPHELPEFFAALASEPDESFRDFILLALLTGQRRENVMGMLWTSINLDLGEWRIARTKNGSAHLVPLVPEAVEILRDRSKYRSNQFVFPAQTKTGCMQWPYPKWHRLCARAGLENLRIHDLRRSLASWQARCGASLAIIGKTLNHKTAATTMIYSRLDLDPIREAMEKATSAMFSQNKVESTETKPAPQQEDSK